PSVACWSCIPSGAAASRWCRSQSPRGQTYRSTPSSGGASRPSWAGSTGGDGESAWVPVRYLYRSYSHAQLAALYRAAAVGYVTPLRDGMNLVAKEFVAAPEPGGPGGLLLATLAAGGAQLTD